MRVPSVTMETVSQALSLPASEVAIVLPLVPNSKSADNGGWGLGESEEEGLSDAEGEKLADGESEALGETLGLT